MRMEAEFYGIQKIVDHIDFLEAEKKSEDKVQRGASRSPVFLLPLLKPLPPIEVPYYGDTGCYVDEMDKNAFMFGEGDKVTLVSGEQAYTQAMVRSS